MAAASDSKLRSLIQSDLTLRETALQLKRYFLNKKVFILVDSKLKKKIYSAFLNIQNINFVEIKVSEKNKTIKKYIEIQNILSKKYADRNSVVVTIGGGHIGDLGGFVAATYMRGIEWINIPTTLLSMVDSSLGGKVGINLFNRKNLIGSFYSPSRIYICSEFLETLTQREIDAAFGELVKYSLVVDRKRLELFINSYSLMRNDRELLAKNIKWALSCKQKIVDLDPFERKNIRTILNFGHTFAHALESSTRFLNYSHGEAVIWGMRYAVEASFVSQKINYKNYIKFRRVLDMLVVPDFKKCSSKKMWELMIKDKKNINKNINFVFLTNKSTQIDLLSNQVHIQAFQRLASYK